MAKPGEDRDHPIEIGTTDDEKDVVHTTDSEPIMPIDWHLKHGFDVTPKALRNARQDDSTTPRASLRKKLPSASPTKGKQRATTQIYPLPADRAFSVDSDGDKRLTPPSAGSSSQLRALSPAKSSLPRRKHQVPVSGAPGSWENPEEMVFSDGHMIPRSSASESERPRSRGSRRSSRRTSNTQPGPSQNALTDQPAQSSTETVVQPTSSSVKPAEKHSVLPAPGSWQNPIEYRPSHARPVPSPPPSSNLKRRPSPPSPQPDASTSRNKHARLDTQTVQPVAPAKPLVKRLGPTWRTDSRPPTPLPVPKDTSSEASAVPTQFSAEATQAMELDEINQVSAALGEDSVMEDTEMAPGQSSFEPAVSLPKPSLSTASPVVIPPLESPNPADHATAVAAIRQSSGTIDHDTSTAGVSRILRLSPKSSNNSDILIAPLPSHDIDVNMDDWLITDTTGPPADVSRHAGTKGGVPELEAQSQDVVPQKDLASARIGSRLPIESRHEFHISPLPVPHSIDVPSSPQQVERAVEIVREGVGDVDINAPSGRSNVSRSPSFEEIPSELFLAKVSAGPSKKPPLLRTRSAQKQSEPVLVVEEEKPPVKVLNLGRYENMSRSEWRSLVEKEKLADTGLSPDSGTGTGSPFSSQSTSRKFDDQLYVSIAGQPTEATQQPPEDRRGVAKREFNSAQIDEWNRRAPFLTHNPALHRRIFEAFIAEKELNGGIGVSNDVDHEGAPPDFEFEYSNDMLYHPDVPDPEKSLGCDCDGPCDPKGGCSCVRRQEAYYENLGLAGFAYDESGLAKFPAATIWECSETCGCPPSCMNRVIQHGRKKETRIEIFKTRSKGWGVRAKAAIPKGQFIGIYSGELITESESEKRGVLYDEIGRTYIFDLDGWHLRNPPQGLARIDARLAETAASTAQRANEAQAMFDEEDECYSAYSVDAFHYGNYTRYFNHSCDPNLEIAQCYVYDFHPERPLLCIFSRRPIRQNEEMCISYKGIPDDLPATAPSPVKPGRKGKHGKRSSAAHVSQPKNGSGKPTKHPCFCKSWNCDGSIFN